MHRHHVVPLHMGGSDTPDNVVVVTKAEHAEAHRLLWLAHGKREDFCAWQFLLGQMNAPEISKELRREWARRGGLAAGKSLKPKKPRGAEWRRKLSEARIGKSPWNKGLFSKAFGMNENVVGVKENGPC